MNCRRSSDGRLGFIWLGFTYNRSLWVAMNVRLHTFCVVLDVTLKREKLHGLAFCFHSHCLQYMPSEAHLGSLFRLY